MRSANRFSPHDCATPAPRFLSHLLPQEIATCAGLLGHYGGDAAMPLHVSVHRDGWQAENPKQHPTDAHRHGRMESRFVDLLQVKAAIL